MGVPLNKRKVKALAYVTAAVFVFYIPLNFIYILTTQQVKSSDIFMQARGSSPDIGKTRGNPSNLTDNLQSDSANLVDRAIRVRVKDDSESVLKLKDIVMQSDGTVDLRMNLNMADMVKILNAYSDGSFAGDMTMNKLPVKVGFLIESPNVCDNAPNLQILIYVHTAVHNVERRTIIRSTWARRGLFKEDITRLVFLMGRPKDKDEEEIVQKEGAVHRDLVVGDFTDHYKNLTLKAILGLKWASLHCQKAQYVIKADDDAFVNIFEIRKILKANAERKRLMVCPLWKEHTMPILRDPAKCMKWCVKYNEFPGRTHFPKYCAGLTYIMSQEVVPEMYDAALKTPFFWIDDVYISGVVAPKVKGLEFVDLLRNFTLKEKLASEEYLSSSKKPLTFYFAHVKTSATFYQMWNATLHRLNTNEVKELSDDIIAELPALRKLRR